MEYKDFRKMFVRASIRYNIIGLAVSAATLLFGGFVVAFVNECKTQSLDEKPVEVPEETTEESED